MQNVMKNFFKIKEHPNCSSTALLILRLIVGGAFVIHGSGKMQHPFDWMGPQATVPAFFQFLAAFSEFGGGIAWILGLVTSLASLGIFFTMSVAVYTHKFILGDSFVNLTGGSSFELAAAYWSVAVNLMILGPGKFSLDRKIFGNKQ